MPQWWMRSSLRQLLCWYSGRSGRSKGTTCSSSSNTSWSRAKSTQACKRGGHGHGKPELCCRAADALQGRARSTCRLQRNEKCLKCNEFHPVYMNHRVCMNFVPLVETRLEMYAGIVGYGRLSHHVRRLPPVRGQMREQICGSMLEMLLVSLNFLLFCCLMKMIYMTAVK